jgi:hypothetical protein
MIKASSIVILSLASADTIGSTRFAWAKRVLWPPAKVRFLRRSERPALEGHRALESKVRFLRTRYGWIGWNAKSEVFTHGGLDVLRKTKKVLGAKVRFLRLTILSLTFKDTIGKSELFTHLARLVVRTSASSPCTIIGTGKSEVSTLSEHASLDARFAHVKVRFLRILEVVTHCEFVIYKKVSQAY